jgi:hypothetical protein
VHLAAKIGVGRLRQETEFHFTVLARHFSVFLDCLFARRSKAALALLPILARCAAYKTLRFC